MDKFLKLAVAFVLGCLVDGVLTVWATNNGFVEMNPLMRPIAHTWLLPAWKTLVAIVAAFIVLRFRDRFPKAVSFALVAGIGFQAYIISLNILELI